jgi:tRNA threonylcarbamoyl adenosine modification protein YeaZ
VETFVQRGESAVSVCLAFDTSGRGGAVAVARQGSLLGVAVHDAAQGYAEEVFGLVDAALSMAGLGKEDVEMVAVVRGPGSFTGLRIGVMTAKTVAYARSLPLRAAVTLEVTALGAELDGAGDEVGTLIDAGGGQVWPARFRREKKRLITLDAVARRSPSELDPELPWWTAEPGLRGREGFPANLRRTAPLATLLAVHASKSHPVAVPVEPDALVPEYVSPSQAERVHGVDMRQQVHRPIKPRGWT